MGHSPLQPSGQLQKDVRFRTGESCQWRSSGGQVLPQESKILNLDLSRVQQRLVEREHWEEKHAAKAIRRYKNFLILIAKYPDHLLAPAPDMDEAWHNHILFTREYFQACEEIFGGYLHHTPAQSSLSDEKERMEYAQQHTADLYRQEFNEPYHLGLDVAFFW
jgi:hypothetical protein